MKITVLKYIFGIVSVTGILFSSVLTQNKAAVTGTIRLSAKLADGTLKRKKFYLFRGGLKDNEALIERAKNAQITSRSCFIQSIKASPQLACWLNNEKNEKVDCESAYCRQITTEDIDLVPEFKSAFQLTLKQVGGRKEIAQKWLTTNLPADVRDGYYRSQKTLLKTLLGDVRPVLSTMTDNTNGLAYLVDIPLLLKEGSTNEIFTISNIVPMEVGSKSFVWSCEAKVEPNKTVTVSVKSCKVYPKDLQICNAAECVSKGAE